MKKIEVRENKKEGKSILTWVSLSLCLVLAVALPRMPDLRNISMFPGGGIRIC